MEEWLTLDNFRKAAALIVVGIAIAVPLCKTIKHFWQQTQAPLPDGDKPSSPDKPYSNKAGCLRLLKKTP